MKIYTTYFAKLKQLNRDIVPIAVCLYPPKGWVGLKYEKLCPDPRDFREYKNTGDWEKFGENYCMHVLAGLSPDRVVKDLETLCYLGKGSDVALVCYEKDVESCHRGIVAQWLEYNGYTVEEL